MTKWSLTPRKSIQLAVSVKGFLLSTKKNHKLLFLSNNTFPLLALMGKLILCLVEQSMRGHSRLPSPAIQRSSCPMGEALSLQLLLTSKLWRFDSSLDRCCSAERLPHDPYSLAPVFCSSAHVLSASHTHLPQR